MATRAAQLNSNQVMAGSGDGWARYYYYYFTTTTRTVCFSGVSMI